MRVSAVCLLLLCAFGTPVLGQAGRDDARRGPRPSEGRHKPTEEERERSRVRLGITREQQTQLEAVYEDNGRQMREITGKLRETYKQLNDLYDAYDYDKEAARRLRREIVGLRRRVVELHGATEDRLRAILNREQFERMRRLMREERDRRMRQRPGRPPGSPVGPGA